MIAHAAFLFKMNWGFAVSHRATIILEKGSWKTAPNEKY
jgi:hypothetical protein